MLHKVQPGVNLGEALRSQSRNAGTADTPGVYVNDILGQILYGVSVGSVGAAGTLDAKFQESDDDVTYTDVAGADAFTQMTAAGYAEIGIRTRQVTKKYVRLRTTVGTNAVVYGVSQVYVPSNVQ